MRKRNPHQHQMLYSDLFPGDGGQVIVVLPASGWELVKSLVAFYSTWRTQYALSQGPGLLYEEISDAEYKDILDLVARIPEEQITVSSFVDDLCDCIAATIQAQTAALQSAIAQLQAGQFAGAQTGTELELPENPENPVSQVGNEEACLLFQAYIRWATDIMKYVIVDCDYEYLVSAGVLGLLTLIPPTAGLIVPVSVFLAVTAIALSHFWQIADQQDFQEYLDSKDEILCILYNAQDAADAQSQLDDYADAAGWNASVVALFKVLYCEWASRLFFSGLLENVDTTGLDPDACDECVGEDWLFSFVADADPDNEPWSFGVYNHTVDPYSFDPGNDGGCTDASFPNQPEIASVEWEITVPAIPSSKNVTVAIASDDCTSTFAAFSLSDCQAGTYSTKFEQVSMPKTARVFVERGVFSLGVYAVKVRVTAV